MRSGFISSSVILRRFVPGKMWQREEAASTCLSCGSRLSRLNFTLFKGSTIGATRGRKATPQRPHPPLSLSLSLFRALQGFKQLRMVDDFVLATHNASATDLLQLEPFAPATRIQHSRAASIRHSPRDKDVSHL